MNIRQQLVPANITSKVTSAGVNSRQLITVHQTGNIGRGANAAAHANLQARGNSRAASWHWTVDDTEAVQSFDHQARCWHAGTSAGNHTSIGVEICVNSDGNYVAALKNAATLIAKLLTELKLPLTAVVQHNRWTGKHCPTQIREAKNGFGWAEFLDLIRAAMTPPATSPTNSSVTNTVTTVPNTVTTATNTVTTVTKLGEKMPILDLNKPQTGLNVKRLQALLTANGYPPTGGIDGDGRQHTRAAVIAFQKANGLVPDAVVGPNTWGALLGLTAGK